VSHTVDALILDLLEWIGPGSRPYAEVLEAWRTSCPRLPVWEEANERGFLDHRHEPGRGTCVSVSSLGKEHLRKHRERQPSSADQRGSQIGDVPKTPA
jgi:hypothetical protein